MSGITHTTKYKINLTTIVLLEDALTSSQRRTLRSKISELDLKICGRMWNLHGNNGTALTYLQRKHIPHKIFTVQEWVSTVP